MSIIFKEKHYDQIAILLKNIAIIIIVLVVLLTGFNFFFKNKMEVLRIDLRNLTKEEIKYYNLIENFKNEESQIRTAKHSELLIKLAKYAENISIDSIYLQGQKVNLNAVSIKQKNIFELIEIFKADPVFSKVKLLNINHKDDYYFQLQLIYL